MAVCERDLNASELISALKSIETESISAIELQLLREENQRLRGELIERHQHRLRELKEYETKKSELQTIISALNFNSGELFQLKSSMVNVNQNLDGVMDLLFQLSFGLMNGENVHYTFLKLKETNKLVLETSKMLRDVHTSHVKDCNWQPVKTLNREMPITSNGMTSHTENVSNHASDKLPNEIKTFSLGDELFV